jgi:hypothetical protein
MYYLRKFADVFCLNAIVLCTITCTAIADDDDLSNCDPVYRGGVIVGCTVNVCPTNIPTCGFIYQTPGNPTTPVINCSCQ